MSDNILLIFFGMFVVTYIPRVLPLTILSKVKLPDSILSILEYIPIAILGALLLPTILYVNDEILISFDNHYLMAAIVTIIASIFTKKLVVIVIVGIVSMLLLSNFT